MLYQLAVGPSASTSAGTTSSGASATPPAGSAGCPTVSTTTDTTGCFTSQVISEVQTLGDCALTSNVQDDPQRPLAACDRQGANIYVMAPAALSGLGIKKALAEYDATQGYIVVLQFTGRGAMEFGTLTTRLTSLASPLNQVAIVVDGVVQSAPVIQSAITAGSATITGGQDEFTKADATRLAEQVNAATLP